jgi:polyhydroxybutyrate depolymerase
MKPAWKCSAWCLGLAFVLGLTAQARAAGLQEVELARPEGARHYLVQAPMADGAAHPLVILLHGHGGSAAQLMGEHHSAAPMSVWRQIAARESLILAAPDGLKGRDGHPGWNDCRDDAANNPSNDDVGLVDALIEREIDQHHADPARIYAMGMSNGGVFAYRLAAELKHPLAGFVAVSASMPAASACPVPTRPTSTLIIGGTADPLMPYAGGNVHFITQTSRGAVIGAEASAAAWRRIDGLPDAPLRKQTLPHAEGRDKSRVELTIWGDDPAGLQVELLRVDGGGHVEPSVAQRYGRLYLAIVGPQNGDLETVDAAWAFLRTKRLAAPGSPAP